MSQPFIGQTFCCTGIDYSQRQLLADRISALGGSFCADLTSLVSFLVVGDRNTEKYKYSVRYRHDICFLDSSVVDDIYNRWKAGEDLTFDSTLHRLPVFSGLDICVARIERPLEEEASRLMSERFRNPSKQAFPKDMPTDPFLTDSVSSILSRLGATVSTTLTRARTLLIATSASGRRYEMAKQWGIPVLHPIWVYDSCLREAALILADYELSDDFNTYNTTSFVWKKLFLSRLSPKVINTISDRRFERLPVKKSSEIWTSIMESAHPLLSKETYGDKWDETSLSEEEANDVQGDDKTVKSKTHNESSAGLFTGLFFLPLGLTIPEQKVLKNVVESHGGTVVSSSDDPKVSHLIILVRNGPQTKLMLLLLPSSVKRRIHEKSISIVTNWFIERCIYYGKICDDAWARPMLGIVPLRVRRKVCITGFTGVELLHLEKLVSYLNFEFCQTLNSTRDLLVVNINLFKSSFLKSSPKLFDYKTNEILECPIYANNNASNSISVLSSKNKLSAARKWEIPIVSLAFLWHTLVILEGKANLITPDVADAQWCVCAPRPGKSKSLFVQSNSPTGFNSLNESTLLEKGPENNENIRLPSPKKSKDKERYGRLVGRGESLMKQLEEAAQEHSLEDTRDHPVEATSSQDLSTVGYGNDVNAQQQKILLEKLEGGDNRPTKRPRRAAQSGLQ